jgi:hypothetical protein
LEIRRARDKSIPQILLRTVLQEESLAGVPARATDWRLSHPQFDEVAIFMNGVTVFIGFCVIQLDGLVTDGTNRRSN